MQLVKQQATQNLKEHKTDQFLSRTQKIKSTNYADTF